MAVITNKRIIKSQDWIAYVSHDEDDGGWQFHGRGPLDEQDAAIVSLRSIVELDPSVSELADLPLGWSASRESPNSPWHRSESQ